MIPPRCDRRIRAALLGLLLMAGCWCAGCAPKLDPQEYGQIIYNLPQVQGADRPYPLPELEEPEDKPQNPKK